LEGWLVSDTKKVARFPAAAVCGSHRSIIVKNSVRKETRWMGGDRASAVINARMKKVSIRAQ
jgi:hypothetical protein